MFFLPCGSKFCNKSNTFLYISYKEDNKGSKIALNVYPLNILWSEYVVSLEEYELRPAVTLEVHVQPGLQNFQK